MATFVADEHIPWMSILSLRSAGHNVVSIREDFQGIDDIDILKLADEIPAIVITNDRDFSNLIFRDNVRFSAGLIFFRADHFKSGEMATLILHRLREYGDEFENRHTVVSRGRFRQRPL